MMETPRGPSTVGEDLSVGLHGEVTNVAFFLPFCSRKNEEKEEENLRAAKITANRHDCSSSDRSEPERETTTLIGPITWLRRNETSCLRLTSSSQVVIGSDIYLIHRSQ
ncbi:hypothetical protein BaRGS_00035113 [Batillaria attramentaria]|uniref:Uncharacterized protein n=1 Tax=Batillaria attramentaria TaxID=370345 RepID=A0ABD0JFQ0_9CAEN